MSDQHMSVDDLRKVLLKLDPDAYISGSNVCIHGGLYLWCDDPSVQKMAVALSRLGLKPEYDGASTLNLPPVTDQPPARISADIARRAGDVIELLRGLDDEQRRAIFDFAQFALGEEETEDAVLDAAAEARGRGRR